MTTTTVVRGGEVGHLRDCPHCGGAKRYVTCTRHAGYNCPCRGVEVECSECDDGQLFDATCMCGTCMTVAATLADEEEVADIRHRADVAIAKWKGGVH